MQNLIAVYRKQKFFQKQIKMFYETIRLHYILDPKSREFFLQFVVKSAKTCGSLPIQAICAATVWFNFLKWFKF